MSKRIVMSVLSAIAMSVGGFFVSCGSGGDSKAPSTAIVQLPEGCALVSPRDPMSALGGAVPLAPVKPGKNQFVVSCDGRMIEVDKQVEKDQQTVSISEDDVK